MSIGTMLFNPFNGAPRHPDDIASDPTGILVWDGETPLRAASRVTGLVLTYTIDTGHINQMQLESMRAAIKASRGAHHTDICMRINGQDRTWQADWLKHFNEQEPSNV